MKEYRNIQNISTNSILTNWANTVMTFHKVKREWRIAILASIFIKLLTMCFSIFAAYYFVFDLINNSLNSKTQSLIFTILALVSLELITAVFLEKTFKFFFRSRFNIAIFALLVTLSLFAVSFYSSTHGLANRQANRKNKIANIKTTQKAKQDSIIKIFNNEKKEFKNQIEIIKSNPQGWLNGKRSILMTWQLNEIKNIQYKIEQLKKQLKKQLKLINLQTNKLIKLNQTEQRKTANKYYNVMTAIMIIQIFATALLIFFLNLIRNEELPDQVISENLNLIQNNIEKSAQTVMNNSIITAMNKFNNMSNIIFSNFKNTDFKTDSANEQKHENQEKKQIGFINNQEQNNTQKPTIKTNKKTNTPLSYPNNKEQKQILDIDYLVKHKNIVLQILKLNPTPIKTIKNKEIKTIQQNTPDNIPKSRSTIQKVFISMKTVGIHNFDNNGNLLI